MKIKVSKRKAIAFIVAFILIINILLCATVPTHAMSLPTNNTVTSGKLIDMCLTRSGKVVNSDIREDVLNQTRNVLNDTATSYRQWCTDNGKSKSVETFREYLESDAYASLPFRLAKYPLELASFIEWIINGETLLDVIGTDVNEVLTESDDLGNVTVPSETVNIINQCFESVKGDYTQGWKYIDTKHVNELPTSLFGNASVWNSAKEYISSTDNPIYVFAVVDARSSQYNTLYFSDNSECAYTVITKGSNFTDGKYPGTKYGGLRFQVYNQSWENDFKAYKVQYDASQFSMTEEDLVDVQSNSAFGSAYEAYYNKKPSGTISIPYCVWGVYSKNGDRTIVYDNLQAIKDYSIGNTPYYLTNRQYSDSVDNSFNVSGEYIQNNGGTFAYEQIREQINNSNVTNDSSVSNIVNDYSQTIINNYNYSSGTGDGGNGGNGESGGNSILDGLGSIISAITEIIGFLLGVIGDVIGLIGSLFTTVFDGIKAIGSILGGFSSLLGEIFVFIPQELISFLVLAVEASVGIAIWKKFSK